MAQLSSSATFSQAAFVDALGFQPDTFQLDAFDCVDEDQNVIVAAPTGSGKTLVAIYATEAALVAGDRVFYTTPIKALSNQKYHELVERFGSENVGLLTGDNAINPHASVVVMTTEVLRNMLYAGSELKGLQRVVLDEVHYLQDPYRGSVWEEVIIHLPKRIRLVCLSATVSNADELSEWIETVRGPTELVVELTRPVQLESSYLIGEKTSAHLQIVPTIQRGKPNPKAVRYDNEIRRTKNRKGPAPRRRKWKTPGPREVVALLDEKDMLPAIHFIFSRAGCEEAARSVVSSGLVLTTQQERERVRAIVESRTASLSDADNQVLDYQSFLDGLEAGIASHHAGMIPPFKEAVEQCFAEGLTKVVFATETLALGINMPARTVVLDKLTKFTGEHHEFLTPAQYTQLIGRAGRRGIDSKGHSVILWSPFVQFEQIGQLAMSKDFELKSSFRPTYNMAANLVRRYEPEQARQLLNLSFAQFKSDATVVRSEQRTDRLLERKRKISKGIESEFGPVTEIRAALAVKKSSASNEAVVHALSQLIPGEVVRIHDGEAVGGEVPVAVVLAVAFRKGGRVKVTVVDREAEAVHLVPADLSQAPEVVGKITLPEPYIPNSVSFQYEASQQLKKLRLSRKTKGRKKGKQDGHRKGPSPKPPKYVTASEVPQRAIRAVQRLERVERDIERLSAKPNGRGGTLASQFAAVLSLLETRGYVTDWELTPNGQRLARLYHECDLLIIDALDAGLFDELDAPELAGLVSVFVFTDRRRDFRQDPWFPSRDLKRRYSKIVGLSLRLGIDESDGGLTSTRQPDAGFVAIAHAWASGGDVGDVLLDEEIPAGDFIKTINQLIDLLHQIGSLAADRKTARSAQQASDLLYRDLVSVASAIDPVNDETLEPSTDSNSGLGHEQSTAEPG